MVRQICRNVQHCATQALAHRKFALLQPVQLTYTNELGRAFVDRGIVTGFGLGPGDSAGEVWYQVTFFEMESSIHLSLPYQEQVPESELEPLQGWQV